MEIIVNVDGVERARLTWEGPLEGVAPDDIRLARKLKADGILWKELVTKRIAYASFDGRTYAIRTKAGPGASLPVKPSGPEAFRAMESDHPFNEACDWEAN